MPLLPVGHVHQTHTHTRLRLCWHVLSFVPHPHALVRLPAVAEVWASAFSSASSRQAGSAGSLCLCRCKAYGASAVLPSCHCLCIQLCRVIHRYYILKHGAHRNGLWQWLAGLPHSLLHATLTPHTCRQAVAHIYTTRRLALTMQGATGSQIAL